MKGQFNRNYEHIIAPKIIQVSDIFTKTEGREENWGKTKNTKRNRNFKKCENSKIVVWKKRSILFNLPYWDTLT